MERRLFLAIGLSLLVVWLWSNSVKPPQTIQQVDEPQVSETVKVTETPASVEPAELKAAIQPPVQPSITIEKRTEKIISDKIEVHFSNIGASIEKVIVRKFETILPIFNVDSVDEYESVPFTLDRAGQNDIVYSFEDAGKRIVRNYTVDDGDHTIKSVTQVYNKSTLPLPLNFSSAGYTLEMSNLKDKDSEIAKKLQRDKSLFEYAVSADEDIFRKANAHKFSPKESKTEFGKINWIAFRDRYYCAIAKPLYNTKGYTIETINESQLKISANAEEVTVAPGGNVQFETFLYLGPEKISELKPYGFGFEKVKRYYRFGLFDGIAKIIESLMDLIHKFIPNWGATIMIISVIIYFSMYPLTLKGMKSMKRMQSLQPMIVKLKEKHKDNPQKMNKEMMELYKEHKVNPVGGCLPMLLQMPVFIGLYQVLWRSVSFRGSEFLWIKDLSEPDRLFIMPFSLPFLGNEFNLLPVIMIGVMFFQQKLSAKNMVITDPQQAAQQKIMTTVLPVFLGFIFYKFASGLTLYFTMFYIFSTFTQWKMSKVKQA